MRGLWLLVSVLQQDTVLVFRSLIAVGLGGGNEHHKPSLATGITEAMALPAAGKAARKEMRACKTSL